MSYRLGIDIGGTFTDFTLTSDDGSVVLWKEDTTRDDLVRAVVTGLEALAARRGTSIASLLEQTELLVHGTTFATNLLIERDGPRVGLLCTRGFRDVLYFRDGYKPDRFNLHVSPRKPLIDRSLRIGVPGRFDPRGNEIQPLDCDAVRAAARRLASADVAAVAVAFLWSMLYPQHELQAAEILRRELPGVEVLCSHAVLPEIREWERTSATAISAYILPGIREYLTRLEANLTSAGLRRPPLIMQINGGCARVADIFRAPVNILASGPAAAPAGALHLASHLGKNLITVDMGGTSFDVCLIENGHVTMTREAEVADQPVGVPAVAVHSIGAGGGSIAWVDSAGALFVGPRSAGSRPGPACYGYGGTEPTVTDANVILGFLDPDAFLGGRRRLRDDLSLEAVRQHIAAPLGIDPIAAAEGVVRVVNANMVGALRSVSVERGVDPRDFLLVCGGGAGGLHAAAIARDLGILHVFVPLEAGVFCSFGMTVTDVRHDYAAAHHTVTRDFDFDAVNAAFRHLEQRARRELREEGFADAQISMERYVDARYFGQIHQMTVQLPLVRTIGPGEVRALGTAFHQQHQARYNHSRPGTAIECLHWRVSARARVTAPSARSPSRAAHLSSPEPSGTRRALFAECGGVIDVPVYALEELSLGSEVVGPAILAAATTTVVIRSGDILSRDVPEGFTIAVNASPDMNA